MRLYRKPTRPKWRPVISQVISRPGHKHWKDFLDLAYWNVEHPLRPPNFRSGMQSFTFVE